MSNLAKTNIRRGDFVEIELEDSYKIRGTALTELTTSGSAFFAMEAPQIKDPIQVNVNFVDVRLIFSADLARQEFPR